MLRLQPLVVLLEPTWEKEASLWHTHQLSRLFLQALYLKIEHGLSAS